jgi:hypothetical protein
MVLNWRIKMRVLLLCLLVFGSGIQAAGVSASEWGAGLTSVAQTLKTINDAKSAKNESDKKQKDLDADLGKIQGQENQATGAANRQGLYTMPVNNAVAPNRGYPILDPYARPGYWQQRSHQFKFNMGMAAKRAQIQNQGAAKAMAAENAMTNKMLGAVGQLLNTAGSQMGKIGKERDSAARKTGTQNFQAHCQETGDCEYDKEKGVWRYPVTDDEGNTTYKEAPGDWFSDEDIRNANGGASDNKLLDGVSECDGYKQTAYKVGEDCLSRQEAIDALRKEEADREASQRESDAKQEELKQKSSEIGGQIEDKQEDIKALDEHISDYESALDEADDAKVRERIQGRIYSLKDKRLQEQNNLRGLQRQLQRINDAMNGAGLSLSGGADG